MHQPRIVARVSPDGRVALDAEGFSGSACLEATDELVGKLAEMGLSLGGITRTDKPEMSEREGIGQRQSVTS